MSKTECLFIPEQIVSGGQTGVDRGALEAAMLLQIPHGGWCPRGRMAEDGVIPERYALTEHASPRYKDRTRQNVLDSDATIILFEGQLQGGTRLTHRYALQSGKPSLPIQLDSDWCRDDVQQWLAENRPAVLNIAGPRESNAPGIQDRSMAAVLKIFAQ
ncbi:MAG: putative molybdenum carrier protein [Pirellulaceae bacterium]